MKTRRIEILTHRDFNYFNASDETYDSLVELLGKIGFDNKYSEGRAFLLFNHPNEGYQTSIWTPEIRVVGDLIARNSGVAPRETALADFEKIADGFFRKPENNTVLTYPQTYERVRELCDLAAKKAIGERYIITKATPNT